MQEKWHAWLDYRWGVWICATWIACGFFRERRFELEAAAINADRWLLVAILFASLIPTLWHALREDVLRWRRTAADPAPRRPRETWSSQIHALLSYSFVACLLATTYGRVWTLAEIGFRTESPWNWTILVGFLAFNFQHLAMLAIARWCSPADDDSPEQFRRVWIRYFMPRGRIAQALNVFVTGILSPIHEELVYRGFLIYMLGNLLGQPWLAILLGLLLCVLVHLYQGVWAIPSHALFFAVTVGIMYSPAGLLTVLVMHVTNNLYLSLTFPAYVREYRTYLEQVRQQKQEGRAVPFTE